MWYIVQGALKPNTVKRPYQFERPTIANTLIRNPSKSRVTLEWPVYQEMVDFKLFLGGKETIIILWRFRQDTIER